MPRGEERTQRPPGKRSLLLRNKKRWRKKKQNPTHPYEEFDEVEILAQRREEETPIHRSVQHVRTVTVRQSRELPERHAEPAVDETLQVETEHAGV